MKSFKFEARGMKAWGIFLFWAMTAVALHAQTFTALHSFNGADGASPVAVLVQATNGKLYGTTQFGGANNFGTVFTITQSGTLTTLYSFCSKSDCADGQQPFAGLVQAADGNLYGSTRYGGTNTNTSCTTGCGTIFKITPSGALTTIYNFCSQNNCTDGEQTESTLLQATNGNFYGTTNYGGTFGSCAPEGCGTVFKITPSGALTTLQSLDNTDGAYPYTGLIQATNGNFYGTMQYGGVPGPGTVYTITPSGALTTLYNFCSQGGGNCTDGEIVLGGLVQATNGNLYGTAYAGGTNSGCVTDGVGCGTVFTITPSGALTTLHSFDYTDGRGPYAGVIQATDGNFYGTTYEGGANTNTSCLDGCGTIFKITPSGTLTTLYNFCSHGGANCTDGSIPIAGLVQATNGTLYGTTSQGGSFGGGMVFSLTVGLGPFVETNPAFGKVGAAVKILGTALAGTTSVTFNGTAAVFTVNSSSLITTTVPGGASTGKIQVVTPKGTVKSNVPFRVLP